MKVKYKVKAKKRWNLLYRALVRDAVEFAIKSYDLHNFGTLTVKMNYIPEMHGSAVSLDEDEHIIFISGGQDPYETVQTIFHELWHIRQYIYDGLELQPNVAYWKGRKYGFSLDQDYEDYYKLPWEVEARAMEKKLFKSYKKKRIDVDSWTLYTV
jgi:hypothetical protein